jgi:hypothetical protein
MMPKHVTILLLIQSLALRGIDENGADWQEKQEADAVSKEREGRSGIN